MKSLFILLAAALLAGCSVMTSDFSEMRRSLDTSKTIPLVEEKPAEKAEAAPAEESVKESIEAPAIEESTIETVEEMPAIEEPAPEESVKEDQNSEPEADIIIKTEETVFVETESLKISGDGKSYIITDGDETIALKKDEIVFGFWRQLGGGFVYYDGINNKISYCDGSVRIPLE